MTIHDTSPVDANTEMVRHGAAWVYRQYGRDPELLKLEAKEGGTSWAVGVARGGQDPTSASR